MENKNTWSVYDTSLVTMGYTFPNNVLGDGLEYYLEIFEEILLIGKKSGMLIVREMYQSNFDKVVSNFKEAILYHWSKNDLKVPFLSVSTNYTKIWNRSDNRFFFAYNLWLYNKENQLKKIEFSNSTIKSVFESMGHVNLLKGIPFSLSTFCDLEKMEEKGKYKLQNYIFLFKLNSDIWFPSKYSDNYLAEKNCEQLDFLLKGLNDLIIKYGGYYEYDNPMSPSWDFIKQTGIDWHNFNQQHV